MLEDIARKARTGLALVRSGRFHEILETLTRPLIRITILRLDVLELDSYRADGAASPVPLRFEKGTPENIAELLEHWPDSEEALQRHREVYRDYGFENWSLFFHAETGEPVHFQVLVTSEDIANARRVLPWKIVKVIVDPTSVHRGWVYTFEKFRCQRVSLAATNRVVAHCREAGIRRIFSSRAIDNAPSIGLGNRLGFEPYRLAYQIQLFRQRRQQGFYILRRVT